MGTLGTKTFRRRYIIIERGVDDMITKEEYVEKYIKLWMKQISNPEDYGSETKVKAHNKAARELHLLCEELHKDGFMSEKVYGELIANEDQRIRQSAASACLKLNSDHGYEIHIDKSVRLLESISKQDDGGLNWHAKGAERVLKIWRGELDPRRPW